MKDLVSVWQISTVPLQIWLRHGSTFHEETSSFVDEGCLLKICFFLYSESLCDTVPAHYDSLPCMEKDNNFNLHCQTAALPVSELDGSSHRRPMWVVRSAPPPRTTACKPSHPGTPPNPLRALAGWSPSDPLRLGCSVLITGLDLVDRHLATWVHTRELVSFSNIQPAHARYQEFIHWHDLVKMFLVHDKLRERETEHCPQSI